MKEDKKKKERKKPLANHQLTLENCQLSIYLEQCRCTMYKTPNKIKYVCMYVQNTEKKSSTNRPGADPEISERGGCTLLTYPSTLMVLKASDGPRSCRAIS